MKLIPLFYFLLFLGYTPSATQEALPIVSQVVVKETVYICDSENATKYHSDRYCSGLNNCKATIKSIDKSDAIDKGRTECAKCY